MHSSLNLKNLDLTNLYLVNLDLTRFNEQLPAPLNYFTIVNLIRFGVLQYLLTKSSLTVLFVKSRLGCT